MSTQIKDGGPAFPVFSTSPRISSPSGMSLRDYFVAHAPCAEVEAIIPSTVKDIAEWIGTDVYDYRIHYPMALAKARRIWADAMLAAREVQS